MQKTLEDDILKYKKLLLSEARKKGMGFDSDVESLILDAIWTAHTTYDDSKNCSYKTYLMNVVFNNKRKDYLRNSYKITDLSSKKYNNSDVWEYRDIVSEEDSNLDDVITESYINSTIKSYIEISNEADYKKQGLLKLIQIPGWTNLPLDERCNLTGMKENIYKRMMKNINNYRKTSYKVNKG